MNRVSASIALCIVDTACNLCLDAIDTRHQPLERKNSCVLVDIAIPNATLKLAEMRPGALYHTDTA